MNRRGFILSAAGLLVPEPERVVAYSFLPGQAECDWEILPGFELGRWHSVTLGPGGDFDKMLDAHAAVEKFGKHGVVIVMPGYVETFTGRLQSLVRLW